MSANAPTEPSASPSTSSNTAECTTTSAADTANHQPTDLGTRRATCAKAIATANPHPAGRSLTNTLNSI